MNETNPSSPRQTKILHKLCGNHLTDNIVTWEGQGLDLVFHSDMSVSESGYLANVVITPIVQGTVNSVIFIYDFTH